MLKRLSICFVIIFLFAGMVIPAFASSPGGQDEPGGDVKTPAVVIDYLRLLNGEYANTVVDWPNNYSAGGSSIYEQNYNGSLGYDLSFSSSVFRTKFYVNTNTTRFSLFCSNYFHDSTSTQQYFLIDGSVSTVIFESVRISGEFVFLQAIEGKYYFNTRSFSQLFNLYTAEINVDDLVNSIVSDSDYPVDLAYLQNVTIEFSFSQADTSVTPRFDFVIRQGTSFSNYLDYWFLLNDPRYEVEVIDPSASWFDWLLDSVNSFLDFEVAPGFSLNRIFYIVLVIGVLLWFITLLI